MLLVGDRATDRIATFSVRGEAPLFRKLEAMK
jgi:hypothetical protein